MPRFRRSTPFVLVLVALIIFAHVFLWRSDMPTGQKAVWTTLNIVTWTIILAPIFLVERWLTAVRAKKREEEPDGRPRD